MFLLKKLMMNEIGCNLGANWQHVALEVGKVYIQRRKPWLIIAIGGFSADDAMSLPPQVLVLLFTHHLHPGGDGPPRQIETPADQRAAGQAVRAKQHRQQLQPEGKGYMRLQGMQRKNTWDELTWKLEFGQNNWKVFTWPRTKKENKKQLDALKIPTGRKVDDLSTLSVARMTANTLLTRVIGPGCNNGHGVY